MVCEYVFCLNVVWVYCWWFVDGKSEGEIKKLLIKIFVFVRVVMRLGKVYKFDIDMVSEVVVLVGLLYSGDWYFMWY